MITPCSTYLVAMPQGIDTQVATTGVMKHWGPEQLNTTCPDDWSINTYVVPMTGRMTWPQPPCNELPTPVFSGQHKINIVFSKGYTSGSMLSMIWGTIARVNLFWLSSDLINYFDIDYCYWLC